MGITGGLRVSVVVATKDRPEFLKRVLGSLAAQDLGPEALDVIVVDDGSKTDMRPVIDEARRSCPDQSVRLLRIEGGGPGAARNAGADLGEADVFLFIDDDAIAPPGWARAFLECLKDYPWAAGAGGPDAAPPGTHFFGRIVDFLITSFLTTGGKCGGRWRLFPFVPKTWSLAVRRDVFRSLGGFPRVPWGEDTLFAACFRAAGHRWIYCDRARVFHERDKNVRSFAQRMFKWGWATGLATRTQPRAFSFSFLGATLFFFILPVLAALWPEARSPAGRGYLVVLCFYLGLIALAGSVHARSARGVVAVPVSFAVMIFMLCAGFWWALLGGRYEADRSNTLL